MPLRKTREYGLGFFVEVFNAIGDFFLSNVVERSNLMRDLLRVISVVGLVGLNLERIEL